jgi:hypothetical protein
MGSANRVAPDWQVRDFPRRATRPPKQLVIDEQAEPCTGSQRQERRVAAATGAPERMLAQHREIHVVLDRNIRSEAVAQKAEDIEVLQPCDVWSQGNTACARIDRSRNSHHDMTGPRDIDPDGFRELVGAGGDLFGHVSCAARVGGLGQFRHDAATRIRNRCGELGAAEVRRKTIGGLARH